MMLCQLAMDKGASDWPERLNRFATSQEAFYRAVALKPRLSMIYQCQAEFWSRIGDDDMAGRLLRSISRVVEDKTINRRIEQIHSSTIHFPDSTPEWTAPSKPPKILLVTHPRPHYGLDVLYDGLCTVIGASNVTDFPWKPSLHGQPPKEMANYPCMFSRPGRPMKIEDLLSKLREGVYDVVLFGDLEHQMEVEIARSIVRAAGATPLFILDQQDDPRDPRRDTKQFLNVDSFSGVFKREMLRSADYGPDARPLPFAYPDKRVPETVESPRERLVFWAGHRQFGLRRLYLEYLEATRGLSLDAVFEQEEYVHALLNSKIGINIFGCGFDTVRYWELPAYGCMMLAERLPIRIPHDFREGESAVFFDDTQTLCEKLDYYMAHPEETESIARAGHEWFKRYHTGSARARQLLSWINVTIKH
jgi:hypothetical protein